MPYPKNRLHHLHHSNIYPCSKSKNHVLTYILSWKQFQFRKNKWNSHSWHKGVWFLGNGSTIMSKILTSCQMKMNSKWRRGRFVPRKLSAKFSQNIMTQLYFLTHSVWFRTNHWVPKNFLLSFLIFYHYRYVIFPDSTTYESMK